MCLGIPGKVIALADNVQDTAWVDVCGVKREVNVALVSDGVDAASLIGSWVLVHVGFAMSRLDEQEALDTLAALRQMEEVEHDVTIFLKR